MDSAPVSPPGIPPHELKPLTQCRKKDNAPYARYGDVEAEILATVAIAPDTWQLTKLKSETLVHLARWLWPQGDDVTLGHVIDCLGRRIARIARDFLGGLEPSVANELVSEIVQDVNVRIFATVPSRQSEYLEMAFRKAIQRRVINAKEKYTTRSHKEVSASTFADVGEGDDSEAFINSFQGSENTPQENLLKAEETQLRPEQIRKSLEAITDQRHREAVVLHYLQGWLISSKNPAIPTLSTHFGKSERQIQNWLNKAKDEMRAALGTES